MLNKRWKAHLEGDKKAEKDFDLAWAQSEPVRERLKEILSDLVEENSRARLRLEELDNPNWQIKQIHYNTKEKTLLDVYKLL